MYGFWVWRDMIQRESLPKQIYDSLNEARLRIRDTDPVPELNRILLGSLNRYIGMKKPKGSSSVPQLHFGKPSTNQLELPSPPRVFALEYSQPPPTPKVAQPMGNQVSNKPKNGNGKGGGGNNVPKNGQIGGGQNVKNGQPNHNVAQGNKNDPRTSTEKKDKKPFKKFHFVRPWPEGKVYLSKNGNKLSRECEDHFQGFCYKCGHNSHDYTKCRTYTDSTAYLSLCNRCMQGFHDQCKRRWVKESQVADQLKQIQIMYDHLAMNPPRQPFMVSANANQGAKVEEPSDED